MPAVSLQCPLCRGLMQLDSALGGQQVACPHCQGVMGLPPESVLLETLAQSGMPAAAGQGVQVGFGGMAGELVQLACPVCAGPFQLPAAMGGQQVGCPHCRSVMIAPPLQTTGSLPGYQQPDPGMAEQGFQEPAAPAIDDLLPPGAAMPSPAVDKSVPARGGVDERDPPARPVPRPSEPSTKSSVDERLPPSRKQADRPEPSSSDRLPPPKARTKPEVDERLPPTVSSAPAPMDDAPRRTPRKSVDDLLPPGSQAPVEQAAGDQAAVAEQPRQPTVLDSLLPPGAGTSEGGAAAPGEQVALPKAPKRPIVAPGQLPAGAIAVPTPEGGFVTITETPKTIGEGDAAIEVRRLTPEEKARRRLWKNVIFGAVCLIILVIVIVVMKRQ